MIGIVEFWVLDKLIDSRFKSLIAGRRANSWFALHRRSAFNSTLIIDADITTTDITGAFILKMAMTNHMELYGTILANGNIIESICDKGKSEISFIINGDNLGVAFKNVRGDLFPALDLYDLVELKLIK